jgi:ribosomal protein S18 acetylase RimI-like enzyme
MVQSVVTLYAITVEDWRLFRELRLEALRDAPYAFRSTLNDWQDERDTEERWRKRIADVAFNIIAYLGEAPSGMVSATNPDAGGVSELISMWVSPAARGKGVGDALVHAVICWAANNHVKKLSLDVREDNGRARALYDRHGFVDQGRIKGASTASPERRMLRVEG